MLFYKEKGGGDYWDVFLGPSGGSVIKTLIGYLGGRLIPPVPPAPGVGVEDGDRPLVGEGDEGRGRRNAPFPLGGWNYESSLDRLTPYSLSMSPHCEFWISENQPNTNWRATKKNQSHKHHFS